MLESVAFSHDDCGVGGTSRKCPNDIEIAGYMWDELSAPKQGSRDQNAVFGDPIYYADFKADVVCPHCSETHTIDEEKEDEPFSMYDAATPEDVDWSAGIDADMTSKALDAHGVSVPSTWLQAQPLSAIPPHAQAFLPSVNDEVFLGLQKVCICVVLLCAMIGHVADAWMQA